MVGAMNSKAIQKVIDSYLEEEAQREEGEYMTRQLDAKLKVVDTQGKPFNLDLGGHSLRPYRSDPAPIKVTRDWRWVVPALIAVLGLSLAFNLVTAARIVRLEKQPLWQQCQEISSPKSERLTCSHPMHIMTESETAFGCKCGKVVLP